MIWMSFVGRILPVAGKRHLNKIRHSLRPSMPNNVKPMTPDSSASSRSQNSGLGGRALIVGRPTFRGGPVAELHRRGFLCTEVDEPYEAMVHLCKRPTFYSAIILSLNSLYREELPIIAAIRKRFSHVEIWLSDTDGRHSALAEAMKLGANGLFVDEAEPANPPARMGASSETAAHAQESHAAAEKSSDPLLTAEELRALLQETPSPHTG